MEIRKIIKKCDYCGAEKDVIEGKFEIDEWFDLYRNNELSEHWDLCSFTCLRGLAISNTELDWEFHSE